MRPTPAASIALKNRTEGTHHERLRGLTTKQSVLAWTRMLHRANPDADKIRTQSVRQELCTSQKSVQHLMCLTCMRQFPLIAQDKRKQPMRTSSGHRAGIENKVAQPRWPRVAASKVFNEMHSEKNRPLRPVHLCGADQQTKRKALVSGRPRLRSQSFCYCQFCLDRAQRNSWKCSTELPRSHKLGCTHYASALSPCPHLYIAAAFLRSPVQLWRTLQRSLGWRSDTTARHRESPCGSPGRTARDNLGFEQLHWLSLDIL